jgi:hypothetical protein
MARIEQTTEPQDILDARKAANDAAVAAREAARAAHRAAHPDSQPVTWVDLRALGLVDH